MISEKRIKEFQKAVKEDYGKNITSAEANEIINGLVNYFDLLAKIFHRIETNEKKKETHKNNLRLY